MGARKAKRKKPLGPRQAAYATAARSARAIIKRQSMRAASPSVSDELFDPVSGWADVPRQTAPTEESRRRRFFD